jgi:acetate kinase
LIGFAVGSDPFNFAINDYFQQYDQLNKYGAHGFDPNYVPKNALAFN